MATSHKMCFEWLNTISSIKRLATINDIIFLPSMNVSKTSKITTERNIKSQSY
jgi:hypothetical protein